jgi:hypothetical protein
VRMLEIGRSFGMMAIWGMSGYLCSVNVDPGQLRLL